MDKSDIRALLRPAEVHRDVYVSAGTCSASR